MDAIIAILIMLAAWIVVAPIFGLVAFHRTRTLQRENAALRAALQAAGDRVAPASPASTPQRPVQAAARPDTPPPRAAQAYARASGETAPPDTRRQPTDRDSAPPGPAPLAALAGSAHRSVDWERRLAGNWAVWTGGLALALGGLLLVRVAVDAGLFGPVARTGAAAMFGLGLIAAALRGERAGLIRTAEGALRWLPAILAGAGVLSLYGASLAAGLLYELLPPLLTLAAFSAVSVVALSLSLKYGPLLAVIGLAGAYAAPALTGANAGSAVDVLPFVTLVTWVGLALIRVRGWRFMSWISLAGTAVWGFLALGDMDAATAWALPAYALGTGVAGLGFALGAARQPILPPTRPGSVVWLIRQRGETLFAAYAFWALGGGVILLSARDPASLAWPIAGLCLHGGISLLAAWRREGYGLLAPMSAALTGCGLVLWPDGHPGLSPAFLAAGLVYALLGLALQSTLTVRAPLAMAGALTPVGLLALAFWRWGMEPGLSWGLGALGLAVLTGTVLDRLRATDPGFARHPGAAAAYALATALAAALSPFLVLEDLWFGPAMAVVALAIAAIHRRFPLLTLAWSGTLAAGAAVVLLARPGMLRGAEIGPLPVVNELGAALALAVIALGLGGRLWAGDRLRMRAYDGAAMVIAMAGVGLLIRHAAGGGRLFGPEAGLGEASGYAIAYTGMAASLAWRFAASRGRFWTVVEAVASLIGIGALVYGVTLLDVARASGWPVLNLLVPAFALPGLFLAAQSAAHHRHGRATAATLTGLAAMGAAFVWVTAEARRSVRGPDLGTGPASDTEMWAYSVAWIGLALVLLVWGVLRRRASVRYVSLGLLLLSVAKVFLVDLGQLTGAMRAASLIGLGVALIGVALFYQRFVFERRDRLSGQGSDTPSPAGG